jgi:hypothetical protein
MKTFLEKVKTQIKEMEKRESRKSKDFVLTVNNKNYEEVKDLDIKEIKINNILDNTEFFLKPI